MRAACLRGFGPVGTNGQQPVSAPVNVLALLRDPHYDLRPAADFDAAAAAVADLIEAAEAELAADDDNGAARERLAAALAGVKGGGS